jgi:hypothetical protein
LDEEGQIVKLQNKVDILAANRNEFRHRAKLLAGILIAAYLSFVPTTYLLF